MHQLLTLPVLCSLWIGAHVQETSQSEMLERAQEYVLNMADNDQFSGTLLIAKGEEILIEIPLGEASKRFHIPIDMQTKFNLGSMNKMFTAVSVMQLSEAGKLGLQDPISKYVDQSWLPESITEKVSVMHLLTHSSGLGSYFNETFIHSSRLLFSELDDYKPLVQGSSLAFEPGSAFGYSNTGMLLLGVVIEKASGENYFEYVRQHIFKPAGMQDTDSYSMNEPIENLAIGYIRDESTQTGWRNNIYDHVLRGGPAGGGFSTAGDLHRFALALTGGKLLNKDSCELLWSDALGAHYGAGFSLNATPSGQRIVGHSGGFPGISSNLDIFLDSGYIVCVLTNYDQAGTRASQAIRGMVGQLANGD